MPDLVFYYKIFDEEMVGKIPEHSSEFQTSDCGKFKGKVTESKEGNAISIKPVLSWIDSLRPPVGFHLETISISLSHLHLQGEGFKIYISCNVNYCNIVCSSLIEELIIF